ncbi:hypothetical protein LCGC14_0141930 [marine sediment metagenome]|uniref:Mannose-6-phosphate isomerase type II C-terminal domain-containing protein n=1 Tax=marine sediment metagenome TaxID=412755 RepID=A0A0F9Y2R5_9ZZZZ
MIITWNLWGVEMKTIEKPWGKEEILFVGDKYVVKRLCMNPGKRCSKQYHKHKTETIYVLSGVLLIYFDHEILTLTKGDHITILPGVNHRMKGGLTFSFPDHPAVYLECSTTELDDVVRLEDDYGRE